MSPKPGDREPLGRIQGDMGVMYPNVKTYSGLLVPGVKAKVGEAVGLKPLWLLRNNWLRAVHPIRKIIVLIILLHLGFQNSDALLEFLLGPSVLG